MARLVVKIPDELYTQLKKYVVVRHGKLKGELSKTVDEMIQEGLDRRASGFDETEFADLYRRLVEFAPDMIAIHQDGKFVYINDAGVEMLGAKSADELIGKDVFALSTPDWRKTIEERVRSIIEDNEQTKRLRMPMLRLDGTTIDIEVTGIPVTYHGKPASQVWIKDMTEIKRAEKKKWDALRYA
jgi:PAS domain S-box-containing protein